MENGNYTVEQWRPSKHLRLNRPQDAGLEKLYFNQDGIKRGGVAQVGKFFRSKHINVPASRAELGPVKPGSKPRPAAPRRRLAPVSRMSPRRLKTRTMSPSRFRAPGHRPRSFPASPASSISWITGRLRKRGIEEVVGLAGQQLQRKGLRLRTVPRFVRRGEMPPPDQALEP